MLLLPPTVKIKFKLQASLVNFNQICQMEVDEILIEGVLMALLNSILTDKQN
jgi:hypothetical protein